MANMELIPSDSFHGLINFILKLAITCAPAYGLQNNKYMLHILFNDMICKQ